MLALASVTVVVWGQNSHFKQGSPKSTDNGLTLTVFGALVGLGNGDVRLKVGATGNPKAQCCNPSGACKVPGQNPAAANVTSATVNIPSGSLKNGNTPFSVTTDPPTSPIPGAPECPGSSWTENITGFAFTQAALRIQQSSAEGLSDFTDVVSACITYNPPTANGAVSSANFSVVVGSGDPTQAGLGSCPSSLFPSF